MMLQKLRDRLKVIEAEVAKLETQIAESETALGEFKSVEETKRLSDLVAANREALAARLVEWESLSAELE